MTLGRAAAAEAIGTALLLAIVVGSGIMGERLAQGNAAVALLANSIATGTGLYALIAIFGPVSGAHFNPVVSGVSVWDGRLSGHHAIVYMLAQISGAFGGVAAAHAMFGLPIVQVSAHMRPTLGEGFGEFVATFGLVMVISLALKFRIEAIPMLVAAFITSAYWFTSSTSFANPAVTFARAMTDTFAGISPSSVPLFIGGQICGAVAAVLFGRWLLGPIKENDQGEIMSVDKVISESKLTCPHCGFAERVKMPTDYCQFFYECTSCRQVLKAKEGHCCVFCSYGDVPCPSVQKSNCITTE